MQARKAMEIIDDLFHQDSENAAKVTAMLLVFGWFWAFMYRLYYMAKHESGEDKGFRVAVMKENGTTVQVAIASQGGHRVDCWSVLGLRL